MQSNKLKILLIEDDRIEVIKFKKVLNDNFNFVLASNGKKALEEIEKSHPNVVVLDLNMPDTNGIEFLNILKNDDNLKHIPVVVLTTSDHEKDIFECYRLGIAGYFLKPLKFEEYEFKIKAMLAFFENNEFINP